MLSPVQRQYSEEVFRALESRDIDLLKYLITKDAMLSRCVRAPDGTFRLEQRHGDPTRSKKFPEDWEVVPFDFLKIPSSFVW